MKIDGQKTDEAVLGLLYLTLLARSTATAPEVVLSAVPLTTYPGFQGEASFSPGRQPGDGKKHDNSDIYVKLIGPTGPPLRLTTDPAPA